MARKTISIHSIIDCVAKCLEVDFDKILTTTRERRYYDARIIAIHIARTINDTDIRYKVYAEIFNRKNHCFAVYGFYQCEKLMKSDKVFRFKYEKAIACVNLELK